MAIPTRITRALGTMIVYGYPKLAVEVDLATATGLGAEVVEVLPLWSAFPDPKTLRAKVEDRGFKVHSAHGCWGGQTIRAQRVDLGSTQSTTRSESIADLKRCADWLAEAGGRALVIHPGGLSDPEESEARVGALAEGITLLADHVSGMGITLCLENMPPGVHPGSRMIDLRELVAALGREEIGLALDTGHARISSTVREETLATGTLLRTTHVHDNDGRQDSHRPPGLGTIDWGEWAEALDAIDYRGPIILECIRYLRDHPETITHDFLGRLKGLCGLERL